MFRVVRICISMHDSCIRRQESKEQGEQGGVLNSVLQVMKTLPRSEKSVRNEPGGPIGHGTLLSNSSKLGLCQSQTHSLFGAANALGSEAGCMQSLPAQLPGECLRFMPLVRNSGFFA